MSRHTIPLTPAVFAESRRRVSAHAYHTPLLTSRLLSQHSGYDVRLKAEVFSADRVVQDSRAVEQVRRVDARGTQARGDLLVRWQPRTRRRAGSFDLRYQGRRVYGGKMRRIIEDRGNARIRG